MHRFASSLLLLFSATVFVPSVGRCDDSEGQLTVDEVVTNWRQAVASIESVDVQCTRFVADRFAETMAVSKGRLVIDYGRRIAFSIEPYDGLVGELPKTRNGKPYERKMDLNERWIVDHQMMLLLDDDKQEAIRLELAQSLPPVPLPKVQSVESGAQFFERLSSLGRAMQSSLMTYFQLIGAFDAPLEHLPQLTEDLNTRFDIQIINQTESNVQLRLTPLRPFDRSHFQRIDIILSRESWLPEAVRFTDPSGNKTTTFVITKRRINECSEQMDDAFRVNLKQCQCHTIPRSVPTVYSSRGDGKP